MYTNARLLSSRKCFGALLSVLAVGALLTVMAGGALAKRRPAAVIDRPSSGAAVGSVFYATGKLRRLHAGRYDWLAVRTGSRYWPKEPEPLPLGSWQIKVTGLGRGQTFDLVVIQAGKAGRRKIGAWFAHGHATGSYPGLTLKALHGKVLAHHDRLRSRG